MMAWLNRLIATLFVVSTFLARVPGQESPATNSSPKPQTPQPFEKEIKLPDGWTLTPAGLHVALPAVPLNLLPSKSSKSVHVGTSGLVAHQLSVIEIESGKTLSKLDVGKSWYGLTHLFYGGKESLIWSAGASGLTHFVWCDGTTLLIGTLKVTDPLPTIPTDAKDQPFPYVATKATGELCIVPVPNDKTLAEYTAQVRKNCPTRSAE